MIVVVMGVAGSGKSHVAASLASALSWAYVDADDFHPEGNITKMARGVPLDDADRKPWLDAIRASLRRFERSRDDVVLACSALKRDFRRRLGAGFTSVHFVYLKGDPELFERRISGRVDHFFGVQLLASQFEALEAPEPEEAIVIDAAQPAAVIVATVRRALRL